MSELNPTTNLPPHITYIKHPIEVGDDNWAVGLTKTHTILYSRYPFGGKQQKIKMKGNFREWSEKKWSLFLSQVKRFEQFSLGLVGKISRLRVKM